MKKSIIIKKQIKESPKTVKPVKKVHTVIEAFEHSSGNVFTDLSLPNSEEMLAKAELARQINNIIKKKKLTQAEAARALGIDQPKISALASGKLSGFSLERLFRFLNELGQDVTIKIKPKVSSKEKGSLSISTAGTLQGYARK